MISIALDGRMFAINKATGEVVWERKIADPVNAEVHRPPRSGPNCRRAEGNVRRLQETCYFTSARKLGVGSAPMSACLDSVAAAPGVPAATPRIGGAWRVTCAVY